MRVLSEGKVLCAGSFLGTGSGGHCLLGWRPSLLGWRPFLLGWRPFLLVTQKKIVFKCGLMSLEAIAKQSLGIWGSVTQCDPGKRSKPEKLVRPERGQSIDQIDRPTDG